jgi:lysozyme family protein
MPYLTPFMSSEYQRLFDTCVIRNDKYPEVNKLINTIQQNKERYEAVSGPAGVPWYVISIIHCMEGSLKFTTHLHNGDPLTARTRQVPKNRPLNGNPPFTWEESAIDALEYDQMTGWSDWSIAGTLYRLEKYNGWGYRRSSINIPSPYLWSYTNHYTKGKFVEDGKYSPAAISRQCGAAALLRRMFELQWHKPDRAEVSTRPNRQNTRIELIISLGKTVRFAPSRYVKAAEELQKMLNLHGAHLRVDGKAGEKTSFAYKEVSGNWLTGDPRG